MEDVETKTRGVVCNPCLADVSTVLLLPAAECHTASV